jgi:uncharacterized membrane protein
MMNNYRIVQFSFGIISILIVALGYFGGNTGTLTIIGLLALIALILFDIYTPQIANLSPDNPKVKTMRRLNRLSIVSIVLCFSVLNWLPEIHTLNSNGMLGTGIAVVIMVVIGNVAPKLPFNRYMGLRLPWTVRDESTWKIAHKLLGYITFPLVIILIIGSIFGNPVTFAKYCIIAWIAIPGVYSGWYFYMKLTARR